MRRRLCKCGRMAREQSGVLGGCLVELMRLPEKRVQAGQQSGAGQAARRAPHLASSVRTTPGCRALTVILLLLTGCRRCASSRVNCTQQDSRWCDGVAWAPPWVQLDWTSCVASLNSLAWDLTPPGSPLPLTPPLFAPSHQQVGQLALSVGHPLVVAALTLKVEVVKVHAPESMGGGGHVHDAA